MPQRQLAADLGLIRPRLPRDGTVVVHSDEAGYRAAPRLSATASELIGTHLHVITDDVPSAVRQTFGRWDRRRSSRRTRRHRGTSSMVLPHD